MRKTCLVRNDDKIKRIMLYESEEFYGCYIFYFQQEDDGPGFADDLVESREVAEDICCVEYGITSEDWVDVPDPMPHCQHDWVAPVRIVGSEIGAPIWGRYERLENGEWHELLID